MRPLLLLLVLAPSVALAEAPASSEPASAEARPPAQAATQPPPPGNELPPPPSSAPAEAPLAPAAPAPAPQPAISDLPPPPPPPPAVAPWPRLGLRLDLGFPDGAVLALMYRPIPAVRLSAGPAWNYIGYGMQIGVAFTPIRWAVTPVLSADYGHYFNADVSRFVKNDNSSSSSGDVDALKPLLKKIGYDYLNAQLGLEFGSQRGFCFYLRGGLAYFWMTAHGTATTTNGTSGSGGQTRITVTNPSITATIPTLKLGFLYFF